MSDLLKLVSPDLTTSQKTAIEKYVRSVEDEIAGILPINPGWFRLIEGNYAFAKAADNDGYMADLLDYLATLAKNVSGNFQGLWDVKFGLGRYEFSAPIDLTQGSINMSGRGMGHVGATIVCGSTLLVFNNCTGIRVQSTNTSGSSTKDGSAHTGADRSYFRDFGILGTYSAQTEGESYGAHVRASSDWQNVSISNFAGEAFRIEASTASPGGNATSSTFMNCHGWGSRNGMYFTGNNTGSSVVTGGSFNNNRRWGVKVDSSIGSMFFGVETSNNGTVTDNDGSVLPATCVSDGTYRYFAIVGQEAWCKINAPSGTTADNTGWAYFQTAGSAAGVPLWTVNMLVDSGGCFMGAGSGVFSACYAEANNQGKFQGQQTDIVLGGKLANWCWTNGTGATASFTLIRGGANGTTDTYGCYQVFSGTVTSKLGDQNGNTLKRFRIHSEPTDAPSGYSEFINSGDVFYGYNGSVTAELMRFTGINTTQQFNTGVAVPHAVFIRRLAIPSSINGAVTTARQICRAGTSSATYVAASGGATIDTQCRASQVQLAADVADIKAKLQAANLMT